MVKKEHKVKACKKGKKGEKKQKKKKMSTKLEKDLKAVAYYLSEINGFTCNKKYGVFMMTEKYLLERMLMVKREFDTLDLEGVSWCRFLLTALANAMNPNVKERDPTQSPFVFDNKHFGKIYYCVHHDKYDKVLFYGGSEKEFDLMKVELKYFEGKLRFNEAKMRDWDINYESEEDYGVIPGEVSDKRYRKDESFWNGLLGRLGDEESMHKLKMKGKGFKRFKMSVDSDMLSNVNVLLKEVME